MTTYPEPPPLALQILGKDRSHLRNLDAMGWRDEIARLRHLLTSKAEIDKRCEEWGEDLGDPDRYRPGIIDYPIVDVVNWQEGGVRIPALALPALLVKLSAPDAVIIDRVKAALKQWRQRHPFAVSRRGRKASNAVFDTNMFKVWWRNRIVELGELIAWRNGLAASERRKFPNAALGAWLKFDDKKTSISIKLLN